MPSPNPTQTDNPYRAPASEVGGDLQHTASGKQLATRGQRLGAYLLDGLLVGIPIFVLAMLGIGLAGSAGSESMMGVVLVLCLALAGAAGIVNLIMLWSRGQTIGKYVVDIKIVRANSHNAASGVRIVLGRELFRAIIGAIPTLGVFLFLADSLAIFQSSQQCIHDMVADTNVIQNASSSGMDSWDREWQRNRQSAGQPTGTADDHEPAPATDPMKDSGPDGSTETAPSGDDEEIAIDFDESDDDGDVHW